jgi:hypothetical protein
MAILVAREIGRSISGYGRYPDADGIKAIGRSAIRNGKHVVHQRLVRGGIEFLIARKPKHGQARQDEELCQR